MIPLLAGAARENHSTIRKQIRCVALARFELPNAYNGFGALWIPEFGLCGQVAVFGDAGRDQESALCKKSRTVVSTGS
jgi:hypothetical protein